MKINTVLITALVVGSSTAAMADSSFTFQARAQASWGAQPTRVPVYTPAPVIVTPVVRDHRSTDRTYNDRFDGRYTTRYQNPIPTTYSVGGMDCRNWDPMVETSSPCAVFATAEPHLISYNGASNTSYGERYNRFTVLGSREASVPDSEFITVERSVRQLRVDTISGRPGLTSVAIKFANGTWQTVNLGAMSRGSVTINVAGNGRIPISQIAFHTTANAFGIYKVSAN